MDTQSPAASPFLSTTTPHPPILFAIRSYQYLFSELLERGGFEEGSLEVNAFPDGELYQRIRKPIVGRDVCILGGTIHEAATLELYDLACTAVGNGASSLTLCIPYFGYSTMERAVRPGEAVKAKTRARLLSAIPPAPMGNRMLFLDLHSDGIPFYLEGATVAIHLYSKPLVSAIARRLVGDDFVLCSTDAGRAKWVESLANDMDVPASFVLKRRVNGYRKEVSAVSAHVEGKTVILYDDMIRSGETLVNAAQAYRNAGAHRQFALATHGLFTGDSLVRIRNSGFFEAVVCTNSHPRVLDLQDDFLHVESVAGLLADGINGSSLQEISPH